MLWMTSRQLRYLSAAAVAVGAIALSADPAVAQAEEVEDKAMKVGVIDVQRLVFESATGKEVIERLKNLREQKGAEGAGLQQEIEDLRQRVADGRLSLSEDRISNLEKELEEKMILLRRFSDDADRELQKEQEESFGRIERQVMPIITEVGAEQGYTVIFNKFNSGLLFAQEHVDITDMILQRFDVSVQGGD
jgi:outer membrane protein